MNKSDENTNIEGIIAGDEAVIKAFYKKNLRYIRGYVLQNSGNEEDVEDVVQDALVVIYQKLTEGSLEFTSTLDTYFYGICKNIWRNRLRKQSKILLKEQVFEGIDEEEINIEDYLEQKEQQRLYHKYFVKLSNTCKELLLLVFEGKPMKEIAGLTGYSEGYTRKKKFECKKSLIEMIEKDPLYKELSVYSENNKSYGENTRII